MKTCPLCNHKLTRVEHGTLETQGITLKNLSYDECEFCGEIFFCVEDVERHEEAMRKKID